MKEIQYEITPLSPEDLFIVLNHYDADFDYEMQMADVNRQISGIETVFLPASPQLASLSSSVVRELSHFGHDISEFLP